MTTLEQVPAPPSEAIFRLLKLEKVPMPHPYMIGAKHLELNDSMYLDIPATEKKGARCEICREANRKRGERILTFEEHESPLTLFVIVPQNSDLNAIPGLHAYLLSIKDKASELGIEGFAFPTGLQSIGWNERG